MKNLAEAVETAVAALDFERVREEYWKQNAFVFLERFLPPAVVAEHLVPQVERLKPNVHRNYIPRHKKGGEHQLLHPSSPTASPHRTLSPRCAPNRGDPPHGTLPTSRLT